MAVKVAIVPAMDIRMEAETGMVEAMASGPHRVEVRPTIMALLAYLDEAWHPLQGCAIRIIELSVTVCNEDVEGTLKETQCV